ncbi:hypothetical protein ACVWZ3_004804 [Bradyrhizobium sp. i1.3.6]
MSTLIAFITGDAGGLIEPAERGHDEGREGEIDSGHEAAADRRKPEQSGRKTLPHAAAPYNTINSRI